MRWKKRGVDVERSLERKEGRGEEEEINLG